MWITRVSIAQPVLATMVMVALTVLGLFGHARLGVEQLLEVSPPVAFVDIAYPDANPEAVERELTKPVEEALNVTAGVRRITLRSFEDRSQTSVEFGLYADAVRDHRRADHVDAADARRRAGALQLPRARARERHGWRRGAARCAGRPGLTRGHARRQNRPLRLSATIGAVPWSTETSVRPPSALISSSPPNCAPANSDSDSSGVKRYCRRAKAIAPE